MPFRSTLLLQAPFRFVLASSWSILRALWTQPGFKWRTKCSQSHPVVPKGSKNNFPDWLDSWEHSGIIVVTFWGSRVDSGLHLRPRLVQISGNSSIVPYSRNRLWWSSISLCLSFYINKSRDSNLDAPRNRGYDVPHYPKRLCARGLAKLQRSLQISINI